MTIDHVELFVPDRREAARWYERALGFTILREYESWAAESRGPLMISGDGGTTKLALFEGAPPSRPDTGFRRVAFRLDAQRFAEAISRLGDLAVSDTRGRRMSLEAVVDHGAAWSVYFADPYGHQLEITTYDHAGVRGALDR